MAISLRRGELKHFRPKSTLRKKPQFANAIIPRYSPLS